MRRLTISIGLLATFATAALSLAQAPAAGSPYSIAGVVLNANTSQPIHDAEVTLTRTPTQARGRELAASTLTDNDGHFAFGKLPAGKFELHAARRGYVASDYDQHDTGSTAIVTGEDPAVATLDPARLEFRLAPQAVISGFITEDSGDPVPGAQISLFRQDASRGAGNFFRAGQVVADEQGYYEIANLAPAGYYLAVSGTPWYQPQNGGPGSNQARSPLDVAYPTTFYPDATDSAFAAPVAVGAGDHVQINLTLHPTPSLHLTMQIPSVGANRPITVPQMRQEVFGITNYIQARLSFLPAEGKNEANTTVELSGIAPGQYDVALLGPNGESSREAAVNLAADQTLDASATTPLADLAGKLLAANGGKLPEHLYLTLEPQEGAEQLSAPVEADGSFHIHSLHPGTYELVVSTGEFPMTVTRMSATGAAVRGRLITVGGDPVHLTATLAESTAILHGFARQNGKSGPGVFLLLAPVSPSAGREAWRTNQSDSDGSFDFPQVMPGDYTLVAIQEGWTLDWANPESMAKYLAGGMKITVPARAGDIPLKEAVEVQPK